MAVSPTCQATSLTESPAMPIHLKNFRLRWTFLLATLPVLPALGADIVVTVQGLESAQGALGCALFSSANSTRFPLDQSQAATVRVPAQPGSLQCVFREVPAGTYAVAAAHDINGNFKTDRNLVGLPTEPWAVSNNVRPTLRAPRFDEAAFTLAADQVKQIELRLAR